MHLCEWLTDNRRWFILTSRASRIYHRGCKPRNKHSCQTVGHPQKVGCPYIKSSVLCNSDLLDVHIVPNAEINSIKFYFENFWSIYRIKVLKPHSLGFPYFCYLQLLLLCTFAGVGRWSQIEEGTMDCLSSSFFSSFFWTVKQCCVVLGEDRVKVRRKGT